MPWLVDIHRGLTLSEEKGRWGSGYEEEKWQGETEEGEEAVVGM